MRRGHLLEIDRSADRDDISHSIVTMRAAMKKREDPSERVADERHLPRAGRLDGLVDAAGDVVEYVVVETRVEVRAVGHAEIDHEDVEPRRPKRAHERMLGAEVVHVRTN